jgi:hypothetical protein
LFLRKRENQKYCETRSKEVTGLISESPSNHSIEKANNTHTKMHAILGNAILVY